MTHEEFVTTYKLAKEGFMVRWFYRKKAESEAREHEAISARYREMRDTRGDLFEKSIQPISGEELVEIKIRKVNALRRIAFITVPFILFVGVLIWLEPAETRFANPMAIFEMALVFILIFGWVYFTNRNFNRILQTKEKEIVKGVITKKVVVEEKRDSETGAAFFELSLQEMVQVSSSDYRKYALGDCVQIEILSDDIHVKRKVFKTGELPSI